CQFDRLMSQRAVVPHFQPIVSLDDFTTVGFESLARSEVKGMETPQKMFAAAALLDQQCPLSRLLRREPIRVAGDSPQQLHLFFNRHPAEVVTAELVESLHELRREFPSQKLTLEIHEAAVTDIGALVGLRAVLRELQIGLAFDDFGAGQARLVELMETVPECV